MKVRVDHLKTSKVNFIETVAKPHSMLPRKTLVFPRRMHPLMGLWRGPSKSFRRVLEDL